MTTSLRNKNYTEEDYKKRYGLPEHLTGKELDAAIEQAIKTNSPSFAQRVRNDPDEQ